MNYLIGSDPEWFLKDKNQQLVSAIGLIGGTKKHPQAIPELGEGFAIQEDNVALEYNTPPARNENEWVTSHGKMKDYLQVRLDKQGLQPHIVPSESFPREQLLDPRAWVFGCDPDFNAWSLKINASPHSDDMYLRSCGGHIHIGKKMSKMEKIQLTRLLDMQIALPLLTIDNDTKRRTLYGKAGAMRFKSYGLEYRTPSNYWTKDLYYVKWVYQQVQKAVAMLEQKYLAPAEVEATINHGTAADAADFMEKYGIRL